MVSKVIVTGVAGFIGSHLAERLIADGYHVLGVDCFADYYPRPTKEANLANLARAHHFEFVEGDILDLNWVPLLEGAEFIFHEAGQPGVRGSWGDSFVVYSRNNVLATQRLLEAAKNISALKQFVFAASSSIYGDAETYPTPEDTVPYPISPYGITKIACEHLCRVYHQSFQVPTVVLRYFTAYGPRQRPDMAFRKFIEAIRAGKEIVVYGDGNQTRDFTYVSDIVQANCLAMNPAIRGEIFNIGGGSRITVNEVIHHLEEIIGKKAQVRYADAQKGDARHTAADISKARTWLGYQPTVKIEEGLRQEVEWVAALTA